jgi:phenylpropionate dioxygenase-like ring-hydroxylating dioxygenase large terminal subunit
MNELSDSLRVERRVNEGLLGQWYVVAKSVEIGHDKPQAAKALGRNLVLWRGADGKIQCVDDRCPHRGAPLSRGEVLEGNIACRYHGVTLDGSGKVLRVPAMLNCALEGRQGAEAYATFESNDGVFVYFPSAEQPEPRPIELPVEFTGGEFATFLCTAPWECNYRYALDNLVDPMHGPYLHAGTFTLGYGAKQDLVKIVDQQQGFSVSRVTQHGENFDWMETVTDASAPYCRVEIPYPKAAGPGGPMFVLAFITPVDENNSRIFFWRTRKVSGLERELWRFMFRAKFEERHWFVLEQDRSMLAALPDDAREHEMLYQHDSGVTRLRRVLAQKARTQLAVEDARSVQAAK